jgi:hypothetical protein
MFIPHDKLNPVLYNPLILSGSPKKGLGSSFRTEAAFSRTYKGTMVVLAIVSGSHIEQGL